MKKAGWNPSRRNRNIGTAKQGHGQNNRLTIPWAWPDDRVYTEVLSDPVVVRRRIGNWELTFLVEPTRTGIYHPCTIDEIVAVLNMVPTEDTEEIELVILRQPTRKQELLCPVWGRYFYYACGPFSGTAICLEARDPSERWTQSVALSPAESRIVEHLRNDCHVYTRHHRKYVIESSGEATRNTVLFRAIFHEIGHNVDRLRNLVIPRSKTDELLEKERIERDYHARPKKLREDFAHRYAEELGSKLRFRGRIPFPRLFDRKRMANDGLEPAWFDWPK